MSEAFELCQDDGPIPKHLAQISTVPGCASYRRRQSKYVFHTRRSRCRNRCVQAFLFTVDAARISGAFAWMRRVSSFLPFRAHTGILARHLEVAVAGNLG